MMVQVWYDGFAPLFHYPALFSALNVVKHLVIFVLKKSKKKIIFFIRFHWKHNTNYG